MKIKHTLFRSTQSKLQSRAVASHNSRTILCETEFKDFNNAHIFQSLRMVCWNHDVDLFHLKTGQNRFGERQRFNQPRSITVSIWVFKVSGHLVKNSFAKESSCTDSTPTVSEPVWTRLQTLHWVTLTKCDLQRFPNFKEASSILIQGLALYKYEIHSIKRSPSGDLVDRSMDGINLCKTMKIRKWESNVCYEPTNFMIV